MKKSSIFKSSLQEKEITFLMEAHNGLSAKIVETAGFKGIWASGLTISASLGLRDCNEASWTQVLAIVEYMSDATTIPIVVDGDTGYGNFNNVRKIVKKFCAHDIAAICLEDKVFPKTNSFINRNQVVTSTEEFCGKIKAGKDSQSNSDFSIIARTEALIAGQGIACALERAHAYYEAGADAILIHSKKSTADEILSFAKQWNNHCPLIIVPTKYYQTPTEAYRAANISVVIWANHTLRAGLKAMTQIARQIQQEESLINIEEQVAPLNDIFQLVDDAELHEAEIKYLPSLSIEPCVNGK